MDRWPVTLLRDGALRLRLHLLDRAKFELLTQHVAFGPVQTHLFITEGSVGRSIALQRRRLSAGSWLAAASPGRFPQMSSTAVVRSKTSIHFSGSFLTR